MDTQSHVKWPLRFPSLFSLLICLGVGFAIGVQVRLELPKPVATPAVTAPLAPLEPSFLAPPGNQISSPELAPLERLRALASAAKRARHFDLTAAILLIGQLDLGECRSALLVLRNLSRNDREILLDAIASRWAWLDPVDAFNNAQATRLDNDWSNRIGYASGAALVEKDPEAALERITSARNDDLREKAAEWVLPELAKSQGRRATEYLSSNIRLARFEHVYRSVAQEFGRSSPREAIAWANSLSEKRLRDQSVGSVWLGWAEADPMAAAAAMESEAPGNLDAGIISSMARNWSRSDLKAALAWIESIPDLSKRNTAYNAVEFDPSQVSRDDARQLLLSLKFDPTRNEFAEKFGHHLARENIQNALSWAENLPSDKGRERALSSVLQHWTTSDPSAAARYISSQPESNERSISLARAVSGWSQFDPDAAYSFVQTLPPGRDQESAIGGIIETLSRDESKKALELFQTLKDPEVLGRLAPGFIGSLIKSDSATALHIASQIPAESQPKAYHALVRGWALDQPQQAGDWLNTLSPGAARDSAIKAYVAVIDDMDAALATKWAYQIQDPTERMDVVFPSFSRWLQRDKNAARSWVEQAAIPEGFRPYFDRMLNDEKWALEHR